MTSNQEVISSLEAKIAEADFDYWTLGISRFTDEEYDEMKRRHRELTGKEDVEVHTPTVLSNGKIEHPKDRPMLSMQKVYLLSEVEKWWSGLGCPPVIAMPKYDGIALTIYPGWSVATRGDGKIGEDVTGVGAMFVSLSEIRDTPNYGEAIIRKSTFEKHLRDKYKNPRNAVSGILNSLDPAIQQFARFIDFVPYNHICEHVHPRVGRSPIVEAADKVIMRALDYPTDGVVFRVRDDAMFYRLGHTDHHWRGQIALKFPNEKAETVIERIEWTVVNGTVTPVAHLKPVVIGGVEIRKATLHNADRVLEWQINVGVSCVVERAGGVIPKIVKTTPCPVGPAKVPEDCPKCGGPLSKAGKRLYCQRCEDATE